MFKTNKKAQERFLSIWNVLVWVVIAVVIVISVNLFNGFSTDARVSEARVLNQKVLDCIVEDNGDLIENLDESFSIYETCRIKEELFEEKFVLGLRIKLFELGEKKPKLTLNFGGTEMIFLCDVTGEAKPDNCFKEIIFANDKTESKTYQVNVLTASSHNGEEVK